MRIAVAGYQEEIKTAAGGIAGAVPYAAFMQRA
jgi:hypothetical protein